MEVAVATMATEETISKVAEGSTPKSTIKPKGQVAALGDHVFDYGPTAAAEQMKTTWEMIVVHVGTVYSEEIVTAKPQGH